MQNCRGWLTENPKDLPTPPPLPDLEDLAAAAKEANKKQRAAKKKTKSKMIKQTCFTHCALSVSFCSPGFACSQTERPMLFCLTRFCQKSFHTTCFPGEFCDVCCAVRVLLSLEFGIVAAENLNPVFLTGRGRREGHRSEKEQGRAVPFFLFLNYFLRPDLAAQIEGVQYGRCGLGEDERISLVAGAGMHPSPIFLIDTFSNKICPLKYVTPQQMDLWSPETPVLVEFFTAKREPTQCAPFCFPQFSSPICPVCGWPSNSSASGKAISKLFQMHACRMSVEGYC